MTALTRNPNNPNLLHGNKFQLTFARIPDTQFFCQSVMVPGISLTEIPKENPFVALYSPSDKASYDTLNVTLLIDEELQAWKQVHDWIRGMTFPNNFEEYGNLKNIGRPFVNDKFPMFSQASLTLLSSANLPLYRFDFVDIFPVMLSSFALSAMDSPNNILTADATFRYSWYNIVKLF